MSFSVFLMVCLILTTDGIDTIDVSRYGHPVKCYECVSRSNYIDNYCGDPFNASHPKMNTTVCSGQCVKWVRLERVGIYRYQRTCSISKNIVIDMTINLVCMEESRPSTGRICFCEKNDCNTGNTNRRNNSIYAITVTFVFWILSTVRWLISCYIYISNDHSHCCLYISIW